MPDSIKENTAWLLSRKEVAPCLPDLQKMEQVHLSSWIDALLFERLEKKTQRILLLLEQNNRDWNTAFYVTLARNFGFGINSDPFEQLARSLPLSVIRKHRDNTVQTEALFFGQAGFLEEEIACEYYKQLQQEYRFLQKKYRLEHSYSAAAFKKLRTRPGNFPHLKIAQLAALCMREEFLFSKILNAGTPGELKQLFRMTPSGYWKTHYHFYHTSAASDKPLSDKTISIDQFA